MSADEHRNGAPIRELVAWVDLHVLVRADDQWEADEAARLLVQQVASDDQMVLRAESLHAGPVFAHVH